MIKNNSYHKKHTKKLAKLKARRDVRLLNRSMGVGEVKRNKKWAEDLMEKNLERKNKMTLFQKTKAYWKFAGLRAKHNVQRLFPKQRQHV